MKPEPEFKAGDYVRIYSGPYEDFNATVKRVFWHEGDAWRKPGWRYDTQYGDYDGGLLVPASDRRDWHYDRQGYCDNPGRGY